MDDKLKELVNRLLKQGYDLSVNVVVLTGLPSLKIRKACERLNKLLKHICISHGLKNDVERPGKLFELYTKIAGGKA